MVTDHIWNIGEFTGAAVHGTMAAVREGHRAGQFTVIEGDGDE